MLLTDKATLNHYRCPEVFAQFELSSQPDPRDGYFRFGSDVICYGRSCAGQSPDVSGSPNYDALKHARADQVVLRVARRDSVVVVSVADDGVGGATAGGGSGLTGLSDRVAAHGGQFRIESVRGSGTILRAELPCVS